jgi:hypothetical protein
VKKLILALAILFAAFPAFAQTNTPTSTPTRTPTVTPTSTNTPTLTNTPTATPTPTWTAPPTEAPTNTPTPNPFRQIGTGHAIMLHGPSVAITWASNTSPIVVATGTQTLAANDWVQIFGVQGAQGANGIWQCSAVTSTSCVLAGSTASGAYTQGGTLFALGSNTVAPGAWFDVAKAERCYIRVWAPPSGATATVTIENASQPLTLGPPDPAVIQTTLSNPTAAGTYTAVTNLGNGVRTNITAYATPAARIYSLLECYKAGTRIY